MSTDEEKGAAESKETETLKETDRTERPSRSFTDAQKERIPVEDVPNWLRVMLLGGPLMSGLGIFLVAAWPSELSSWVLLLGLVTSIIAIHLYGRQGPDRAVRV